MSNRRHTSPQSKNRSPRRPSQRTWARRALFTEQLESRELLAGDLNFHNAFYPQDVDQSQHVSARDALVIINQLNLGGPRQLLASAGAVAGAAEGEDTLGAADAPFLYDVNNDGYVSASDAMRVVNLLNQQVGEHAEVMEFRIVYLQPGTNNALPSNTITKGTDFEIGVIVQDIRGPDQIGVFGDRGVASASIDLNLNTKALARVELEEVQVIKITGNPTGGSFTLTFNDGTTTTTTPAIDYRPLTESRVAIAQRIQTALASRTNIGAGNVEVVPADAIFNGGAPTDFAVRFQGALGNRNLPFNLTGNPANLTGGISPQIQVTELFSGDFSSESFRRSLLRRYQVIAGQLIADYNTVVTGADATGPDRIDNAGGIHSDFLSVGHFPDGEEADSRLLLRVRMDTLDAGSFTVAGSVAEVDGENLLYSVLDASHGDPLLSTEIKITNPATLTIIEPFSANPDTFNFQEDLGVEAPATPNPTTLDVLTNDRANNASGAPVGALPTNVIITAVNGVALSAGQSIVTAAGGTVGVNTLSKSLNYKPAPNATGPDTFTYTIRNPATGVTDTTTVTINLTAVNDAPINTLPAAIGARTVAEDGVLAFPGNISVADVDAGANDIQTTISVANGTLTLGSTTGLTFVVGTGTNDATMTIQGTVAEINAALSGMQYRPNQDFNGTDTFQINTTDLGNSPAPAKSDLDSMSLTVTAANDAPTIVVPGEQSAVETVATVLEAITVADVDFGATSPSNMRITLSVDGLGTLTLASTTGLNFTAGDGTGDGTMTFTGNLTDINAALAAIEYTAGLGDAAALRTLSITANDNGTAGGAALSASANVTINVVPLDRPFARDDAFTVNEDSLASDAPNPLPVLDNDFKDQGNTLVIVAITQGANGTVTDNGDGTLSYVPNANFFGTDTFTYTINQTIDPKPPEELDDDQVATVTITVTNTPDAPVANDDTATTNEDVAVDIAVLANDRDIDLSVNPLNQTPTGATHTVTVTSAPLHGTTQVISGVVRYTPAQDYFGPDSFIYQISDGTFTDTATVDITVDPVNDAPVAGNDAFSTNEDTTLNVAAPGVLGNDTDVDGPSVTVSAVTQLPTKGSLTLNADGSFTYIPNLDANGTDTFKYRATDGSLLSNEATVTITINAVNDAPVANDDAYSATEDTPRVVSTFAQGLIGNDADVDNAQNQLSIVPGSVSDPANGSVTVNANGTFTYTPDLDFIGTDTFTYRITDGALESNDATVTIVVQEVNDPSTAVNDSYSTNEDATLNVTTLETGVLGNDTDPDTAKALLRAVLVSGPANGNLILNQNGSFSYTPNGDFFGSDGFTYRIDDGENLSNIATVNLTIVSVNDNPVVADDTFTAIKHNPPTQVFPDQQIFVLANDQVNDPDPGETLTIIAVTDPANGTAEIAADGRSVLYTPDAGYEGPDSFDYTVQDNGTNPSNLQSTATVSIDVVNFIPTDISGTVWMDTDDDGLMEDHERRLAGVEIRIQGTSFRGDDVDIATTTDIDGFYIFLDVEPGDYTITETQPFYMRDGKDLYNTTTNGFETNVPIVTGSFNDHFTISIPLLSTDNPSKTLSGNNFGEMGLDSAYINIAELLASTTNNGFLFAIGAGGEQLWQSKLSGWDGALTCTAILVSNNELTLSVTDGTQTRTRTLTQSGTTRFRIIGQDGSGGYLIRVEGSADDFGWSLAAAQPQAEGEADYTRGVDAIMSGIGNV